MVGGGPALLSTGRRISGRSAGTAQGVGLQRRLAVEPPTAQLLRDAAAAGLWIIAPPPAPARSRGRAIQRDTRALGSELDGVLAWDLGGDLVGGPPLEATRRWAKALQAVDPRRRPMVCEADAALKDYTRPPIHVLVARRDVLGTSLELNQYVAWLRQRSQLAMPGTTLWATIQTQPPASLVEQLAAMSGRRRSADRRAGVAASHAGTRGAGRRCAGTGVSVGIVVGSRGLGHAAAAGHAATDEHGARPDRALARHGQLCQYGRLQRSGRQRRGDRNRTQPPAAADVHSRAQPTGDRRQVRARWSTTRFRACPRRTTPTSCRWSASGRWTRSAWPAARAYC